ncbi:hypothetical protein PAXRUDRAFT_19167 [Paxillus rubicundulus Ve08.2h10]|uniref:Retrovirus-related Pol polyprotein from transposon TNT 1-94-like beta-barrel domain-containing protein n=1 Tax=Paxillus rubicundulus Ve08.2h10 TaxID=930991 RepID=A0A0D0BUY6_9AGAM|nr:hypothetical protein PAXRUDRAFT_19167 [Paxillus rubicundulus Ve08.2h10]
MGPKNENKPEGDAQGGRHIRSRTVTTGTTHVTPPGPATPGAAPVMPVTPSGPQAHAGTTPTYYIQHAPISIQAAKLDTRTFKKIEPLDRGKNNWPDWSFAIKLALNQHLVGGYLTGNVAAPDPLTEPGAHNNWSLNNSAIVSALCSHVSHKDQCLLEDVTNATMAWNTLHERHEKIGPIAQILLIQELSELVCHIYRIRIPTEEVFLSIAMLNALSGELNAVQTQVVSLLSSSTPTRPFTSADIRARLNTEQQLLDNEKAHSTDLALAAATKFNSRGTSPKTCSLCGKQGHAIEGCWQPGGGMAGRREEVLAKIRADKAAYGKGGARPPAPSAPSTTPNTPSSSPGVRFDSHGRAYILDSVTGGAVFLATTSPVTPLLPLPTVSGTPTTAEFAGLAHNSPAFLQNLSSGDQYEFDALLAHLGDSTTSVDWRRHSSPPTAHLNVAAPNQRANTTIDPTNEPFFINTSASVHISNTASDFYDLHPIPPQVVSGVGGSGISAVGIGNIWLNVSRGCHITLEDILYIPSAAPLNVG